jgi:hypothetical protein
MGLIRFLASGAGRATRIVTGVALIGIGLVAIGATGGYVLAAVGLAPLLAGSLTCVCSRRSLASL